MWKGGVRKAGLKGDVTYVWPYLKLLCKKHNDQNHVFVVRDVSHIHMYVLMHSG